MSFLMMGIPQSLTLLLSYKISDNQAAGQLQKARQKLFNIIHGRTLKTG